MLLLSSMKKKLSISMDQEKVALIEKIVEEGTHKQLLSLGGIYSELYEKQKLEEALDLAE